MLGFQKPPPKARKLCLTVCQKPVLSPKQFCNHQELRSLLEASAAHRTHLMVFPLGQHLIPEEVTVASQFATGITGHFWCGPVPTCTSAGNPHARSHFPPLGRWGRAHKTLLGCGSLVPEHRLLPGHVTGQSVVMGLCLPAGFIALVVEGSMKNRVVGETPG